MRPRDGSDLKYIRTVVTPLLRKRWVEDKEDKIYCDTAAIVRYKYNVFDGIWCYLVLFARIITEFYAC